MTKATPELLICWNNCRRMYQQYFEKLARMYEESQQRPDDEGLIEDIQLVEVRVETIAEAMNNLTICRQRLADLRSRFM